MPSTKPWASWPWQWRSSASRQGHPCNIACVTNQPSQNNLLFHPLSLGRTYTPQFTTNLSGGIWLPLTTYTGPATNGGTQVTITDTNPIPPQEFYRIGISMP